MIEIVINHNMVKVCFLDTFGFNQRERDGTGMQKKLNQAGV